MCLGVPGRVLSVTDDAIRSARVDFGGTVRDACLAYVPEARVGDYVVVHVGFAISRLEESEALRVYAYLDELEALDV